MQRSNSEFMQEIKIIAPFLKIKDVKGFVASHGSIQEAYMVIWQMFNVKRGKSQPVINN